MSDTFPRQYARTQRLTLGEPRNLLVSPDGQRVIFARSRAGDDPVNCLWVLDVPTGVERLVADPQVLLGSIDDADDLPPEERARRERMRESAGGITAFATDKAAAVTAFALAGRLFVGGLVSGTARELVVEGQVFDPRPDPMATRVAYVSGSSLRIAELDGTSWELAGEADPDVAWGRADFVAAEEMDRYRGYWWSPDGSAIAACRVDDSGGAALVHQRSRQPRPGPRPRCATRGRHGKPRGHPPRTGARGWQHRGHVGPRHLPLPHRRAMGHHGPSPAHRAVPRPALADGARGEPPLRRHRARVRRRRSHLGRAGARLALHHGRRPDRHRVLIATVPAGCSSTDHRSHLPTCRCAPSSPPRATRSTSSPTPSTTRPCSTCGDGRATASLTALTDEPGVHTAAVGGPTVVLRSAVLDEPGATTRLLDGPVIASLAQQPLVQPKCDDPVLRRAPSRHRGASAHTITTAPRCRCCSTPTAARTRSGCCRSYNAFLTSQWFADQGFAVVVVDGRGTPGRGTEWERAVHLDLATSGARRPDRRACTRPPQEHPLDLGRVAIRGWSFGGYLAALAVLRRPDVFHAAVAGAPVTDWRLYDTHYTERYLGDPDGRRHAPTPSTSLLPLADRAHPTAAAGARPGRRQRRRRPHPAAVAVPCWPPASPTRCCRSWASPT